MHTDADSVQLPPGTSVASALWPPPKRPVEDAILIIFSVANTLERHLKAVVEAVNSYRRTDIRDDRPHDPERYVQTYANVFGIPSGAGPGASLGTELLQDLKSCLGAIAFVDDLRPNIAYELGFFHGKGAPVLLLTSSPPGKSWNRLSDLAGSAVARFNDTNLSGKVHSYLDRLFTEMEVVQRWPTYALPRPHYNLLSHEELEFHCERKEIEEDGPFGRLIRIAEWHHPLNITINGSLSPDARFKIALRSVVNAHYSVYFELAFQDQRKKSRQIWLGLSSWLECADYRNDERNLPADPANKQWRYITGTFAGLQRQGHLHNLGNVSLKRIRFRAGEPHSTDPAPVEIGFLDIIGLL